MEANRRPETGLPEPLSGSAIGSFAYYTIRNRLPKIGRQILKDNDFTQEVREKLLNLVREIPAETIRRIEDRAAPDVQDWKNYTLPHQGKDWFQIPWFFAETYFYRRILEATGYFQSGHYQGYDLYLKQKQQIMETAGPSINYLGKLLDESLREHHMKHARQQNDFHQLLVRNVWGNQADLSMWSAGEMPPDHQSIQEQIAHLLVDDAKVVFDYLVDPENPPTRVDFVLDNYGPELVHDIALADFLLSKGLVPYVRFHAKPYPFFVSDVMIKDIHTALEHLSSSLNKAVRMAGERVSNHYRAGRLQLAEDFFWTSPLPFWEMPPRIKQILAESSLVIVKGDLNYRRLAGDLNWPPATPFGKVVNYFPSPLLALRVHKAELALGLTTEQVRYLGKEDPGWMVNGNWAVVQFYQGDN
jgi:hypothetical protein